MTDPRISPVVRLHDDARVHHFAHMQLDVRVLVSTDETGGAQSVTEFAFRAPFAGPPLHWHRSYAETFVCLEGRFTLVLEDTEREMRPGDVAYVPPRTVHTYRVETDAPTRYLLICSPGGNFESYVADAAAHAAAAYERGELLDEQLMQDIRGRHQTYEASVPRF